jgi:hypothetical protein
MVGQRRIGGSVVDEQNAIIGELGVSLEFDAAHEIGERIGFLKDYLCPRHQRWC